MADPDVPPPPSTAGTFAYEARSTDGRTYRGTLEAPALDAAAEQLRSLQLTVTRLEPATTKPPGGARLGESDFLFVNRQLSHLTAGGLPMERGLRLIADELPRRQADAVRAIAADLEAGAPIGDAFAARAGTFPHMYGQLLEAGVRVHDLPGVLVNLGRHVEMLQRLRAAVWRAAAYPLTVAVALLAVMAVMWGYIIPHLSPVARGADLSGVVPRSPWSPTPSGPDLQLTMAVARGISYTVMGVLAAVLLTVLVVAVLARTAGGRRWLGPMLRPVPVVGPILRWNEVARWCDAVHLAVAAGLDVPAALGLAGQAVDSAAARADTRQLIDAVQAGRPMEPAEPLKVLPPMVPASLSLGVDQNDLPAAAATLARMYQEQAEVRLAVVPQVLSPALLLLTAGCVGLSVAAALLPLVVLLRTLMR